MNNNKPFAVRHAGHCTYGTFIRKLKLVSGAALLFQCIAVSAATAAPVTWDGGTGDWTVAANWSPDGVPAFVDQVDILNVSDDVTINTFVHRGANTNNSGTLNNTGTLNNGGDTFDNDGILDNSGTLNNNIGTLENTGTLDNSGTLDNIGTVYNSGMLDNSGTLDNGYIGTISNSRTSTLNNTGTLENTGTVLNEGVFNVTSNGVVTGAGSYTQFAGSLVVDGTMNQASVAIHGGTLGGSGTIHGEVTVGGPGIVGEAFVNGGTVGPGNSPGLMQVFGDMNFMTGSTLAVELGGLAFGTGYDRVDVADDAGTGTIEGTVSLAPFTVFDIDWFGAFTAGDGDFFDVLVADEFAPFSMALLFFEFSGAALGSGLAWETALVDFGGGREALRLSVVATGTSAIPAPGAILIFAMGLAGLGYARRKGTA